MPVSACKQEIGKDYALLRPVSNLQFASVARWEYGVAYFLGPGDVVTVLSNLQPVRDFLTGTTEGVITSDCTVNRL